ncbi:hypothetical protein L1049_003863 [Liquidambar formosana]|uniref:Uncharacterized protein n=1 Tax=Liquidambar formosana TaxID=63359 RepID=A0AAP0WVI5_LIQFO
MMRKFSAINIIFTDLQWRKGKMLRIFILQVGILYDEISLQRVLDITTDWTSAKGQMLRNETPFQDGLLRHVAEDVVKLAKDGLERRGFNESGFLNEVADVARTGTTPAEKLLEMYHGRWGQCVDLVFEELLY